MLPSGNDAATAIAEFVGKKMLLLEGKMASVPPKEKAQAAVARYVVRISRMLYFTPHIHLIAPLLCASSKEMRPLCPLSG